MISIQQYRASTGNFANRLANVNLLKVKSSYNNYNRYNNNNRTKNKNRSRISLIFKLLLLYFVAIQDSSNDLTKKLNSNKNNHILNGNIINNKKI